MISRRALLRHLAKHGCMRLREGGNHSIWHNPVTDARSAVARHREIPATTARAICDQLGVPRLT